MQNLPYSKETLRYNKTKTVNQFQYPGTEKISIYLKNLFGVLRRFQHCTGHITTGSWKGRGNQYIQFVRVLYCKLPTNSKQLPAFPLDAVLGIEPRPQRWEARVLPLCHRGPEKKNFKNHREHLGVSMTKVSMPWCTGRF